MSDSLDRRLTIRERISVGIHSIVCEACVRYLAQVRIIRKAVVHRGAEHVHSQGLSKNAKKRIAEALGAAGDNR